MQHIDTASAFLKNEAFRHQRRILIAQVATK
jgi:hypothetical protein